MRIPIPRTQPDAVGDVPPEDGLLDRVLADRTLISGLPLWLRERLHLLALQRALAAPRVLPSPVTRRAA